MVNALPFNTDTNEFYIYNMYKNNLDKLFCKYKVIKNEDRVIVFWYLCKLGSYMTEKECTYRDYIKEGLSIIECDIPLDNLIVKDYLIVTKLKKNIIEILENKKQMKKTLIDIDSSCNGYVQLFFLFCKVQPKKHLEYMDYLNLLPVKKSKDFYKYIIRLIILDFKKSSFYINNKKPLDGIINSVINRNVMKPIIMTVPYGSTQYN